MVLAMALLAAVVSPPMRAAKAEETVTCAVCGKQVKKSKAIKVIQDGRVYYVCSNECRVKLQQKKKKE
jgi:YHS domain-containing protein